MSRYHPLDVRHPANRRFANPNYLLDPPAPSVSAPSRAPAALHSRSEAVTRTASASPASAARAPWGGRQPTPAARDARRSGGGFWRTGFWLLVFGGIVAWQNGFMTDLTRWARFVALDLGLPWPF